MAKINELPQSFERLIQNAADYGLAMAAIATPEQIAEIRRQNELFERGLEICKIAGKIPGQNWKLMNCVAKTKFPFD